MKGEVCERHHVLKRSCEICHLEAEIKELKSIALWSMRRLHPVHKPFIYDEYEKATGDTVERL